MCSLLMGGLVGSSSHLSIEINGMSNLRGMIEAIPDLTPMLKPSTYGDVAAYLFFSAGGLFIGGETGLLTGTWSAQRTILKDGESKARIERAFRRFKADVLRREI